MRQQEEGPRSVSHAAHSLLARAPAQGPPGERGGSRPGEARHAGGSACLTLVAEEEQQARSTVAESSSMPSHSREIPLLSLLLPYCSAKNLVAHPVGSDSPRELCQSHNSHKRNLVVLLSYCSDKQPEKRDMMSKTQLRFSEEGE